jgi:hypothetical protein
VKTLPQRINVIKTITYEVGPLRREASNDLGIELDTVDDILEYIEEWVAEDFGGLSNLIFQDENGNEL